MLDIPDTIFANESRLLKKIEKNRSISTIYRTNINNKIQYIENKKMQKKKNYVLTDISVTIGDILPISADISADDSNLQDTTPILHVLEVVQARKATNSIVISHFGKIMLQKTPTLTLSNKHGSDISVMSKSIKFLPP